jgi:hypothetical protein
MAAPDEDLVLSDLAAVGYDPVGVLERRLSVYSSGEKDA